MDAPSPELLLLEENALLRSELDALRQQVRTFQTILDHAPILISTKDLRGHVTMANRHFEILDGYHPATFVGASVFDLFPPGIAEQLWRNDRRAARERRAVREEEAVYHRDQSLHTYQTIKFPIFDEQGAVVATGAVSLDVTATRQAENDSVTDELTGLKNRRYFNMRFHEEQMRAQRDNRLLCLLLLDVDRFKEYNDHYGHPHGDAVLKTIASCLRGALNRGGDLCFRIGGDEFACLFAANGEEECLALARQIHAAVADCALEHSDNPPGAIVTLSSGAAFLHPGDTADQQALYEQADQALYRAKHQGRNQVAT